MKKKLLALAVGLVTMATPMVAASPASAEPLAESWECAGAWGFDPIPRGQYWGCPQANVLISDLYTGNKKRLLDGPCGNRIWRDAGRTKPTVSQAYQRCTIKVF